MAAKNAILKVKDRLSNFDVDLECDITACITYSASVMKKFGRETSPIYVTCLAMHLYVCDFLHISQKQ